MAEKVGSGSLGGVLAERQCEDGFGCGTVQECDDADLLVDFLGIALEDSIDVEEEAQREVGVVVYQGYLRLNDTV